METFQRSCKIFLRQDPKKSAGSSFIPMQIKDWLPACKAAMSMSTQSNADLKHFFEKWFTPFAFYETKPVEGLFTGYYSPTLKGSLEKTDYFSVPIYAVPNDLITVNLGLFDTEWVHRSIVGRLQGRQLIPYYTREEINQGAIKNKARVLAWIGNRIDRIFLEIQGSGTIELPNGELLYLGYEEENGASYKSIAQVLIDEGIMTKHNASMPAIRKYLENNPHRMDEVLHQNKSFVFFTPLKHPVAFGAQGAPLTPGVSMAVDRKWIPLGTPIWVNTTRPEMHSEDKGILQRLMIAQDVGGAIRGPVRGDLYWGTGEQAAYFAGHMKNKGYYWLLLPAIQKF
jgi:membrane-bound lytic murein transglycosylase A